MIEPDSVVLAGDEVAIRWNDGSEDFFKMEVLRAASPSAENQGERDLLGRVYGGDGEKKFDGVEVVGYEFVGGYAIQFRFSDGHDTGLYPFDYLKKLGSEKGGEINS